MNNITFLFPSHDGQTQVQEVQEIIRNSINHNIKDSQWRPPTLWHWCNLLVWPLTPKVIYRFSLWPEGGPYVMGSLAQTGQAQKPWQPRSFGPSDMGFRRNLFRRRVTTWPMDRAKKPVFACKLFWQMPAWQSILEHATLFFSKANISRLWIQQDVINTTDFNCSCIYFYWKFQRWYT